MITRRRFLAISASLAALPVNGSNLPVAEWRGRALGADAKIVLAGLDGWEAEKLFRRVAAKIEGIERQFSLFRDSALTRLNRDGRLAHPSEEFRALCDLAGAVNAATEGAFDPSIQPLWHALATGGDADAARRTIGWSRIRISAEEIQLAPGMGLTFNGIGQGWAADIVSALLRNHGLRNVMVDMGEIAAHGQRPGGGAWRAEVVDPECRVTARLGLQDRALATSAPSATRMLSGAPHILNPKIKGGTRWRLVSVSAPGAALADALSTAFSVMDRKAIDRALTSFPDAKLEVLI